MYSIVDFYSWLEIKGKAKTLFGTKDVSIRKVRYGSKKVIKSELVEEEINKYKKEIIKQIYLDYENGAKYFMGDYWANEKLYHMVSIDSVEVVQSPKVEEISNLNIKEFLEIVNLEQFLEICKLYEINYLTYLK